MLAKSLTSLSVAVVLARVFTEQLCLSTHLQTMCSCDPLILTLTRAVAQLLAAVETNKDRQHGLNSKEIEEPSPTHT